MKEEEGRKGRTNRGFRRKKEGIQKGVRDRRGRQRRGSGRGKEDSYFLGSLRGSCCSAPTPYNKVVWICTYVGSLLLQLTPRKLQPSIMCMCTTYLYMYNAPHTYHVVLQNPLLYI